MSAFFKLQGGVGMLDLYEEIRRADSVQIVELVETVINRYSALFPDWEISIIFLEKSSDRNEQICVF